MSRQLENYPSIPIAYPDDIAKAQPGRLNIFMNPLDTTYYGKDHYGKLHPFGGGGGGEDVWNATTVVSFATSGRFGSFFLNIAQGSSGIESEVTFKYNGSGVTLSDFSIRVTSNSSTTDSVLTVRINGVDTAINIPIPVGFTGVLEDLINTAIVANGDLITFQLVGNDARIDLTMVTIIAS